MQSVLSIFRSLFSRWNLSKKIAVSFFLCMTFALLFGMLFLFASTSRSATEMNSKLNQENLEIARNNIEKQIKSVEMSVVGTFFQEGIRQGLINEDLAMDLETFNRVHRSLISLRAMEPEILAVSIYPRTGEQPVLSGGQSRNYHDYYSFIDYYESRGIGFDSFLYSSRWVGLEESPVSGNGRYCFVNIRVLREKQFKEPIAVMAVYYDERSIRKSYEFFGSKSFIMDKRGFVVSSAESEKADTSFSGSDLLSTVLASNNKTIPIEYKENGAAYNGFSIYLASIDSYLIIIPDETLFRATMKTILVTLLLLIAIGLAFSYVFTILLSRELTKPITELKSVMGEALAGDYSVRFKGSGADETVFLGETFNTLLDSVNNYIEEIKDSVKLKNEAKIKFLQSQINPHLLYNTLDSALYFLSQGDNAAASKTVEELSKFFKLSLSNDSLYVELATELHHIRCYMELQRICRGKEIKLKVIDQDDLLKKASIVKTTLQPIVENTYLHAFEGSINDGVIEIELRKVNGNLKITVTDDGMGIDGDNLDKINDEVNAEVKGNDSFGLWNVNRRLKACYGNEYGLSIESEFCEYTRVTILVPIVRQSNQGASETKDREQCTK